MKRHLIRSALLSLFFLHSSLAQAEAFTIAAASVLRFALDEVVEAFHAHHPGHEASVVYGSSGRLTTQIMHGAPYDVFFSADIAFPERLHAAGLTATEPAVYAIGRMVIWSSALDASMLRLEDLATDPRIRRVAIAQPAHAPYGQRAQEALETVGVWDAIQPRLVFGENIARAAQMVESGAAQVGIIALSQALLPALAQHPHHLIDDSKHLPLTQGFVVTRRGAGNAGVQAFVDFKATPEAHAIMQRFGFVMPGNEAAGKGN